MAATQTSSRALSVPVNGYWVFDDQLVQFGYFVGDGTYLDDELTDDAEIVCTCAEAFECVRELAIPHTGYGPAVCCSAASEDAVLRLTEVLSLNPPAQRWRASRRGACAPGPGPTRSPDGQQPEG